MHRVLRRGHGHAGTLRPHGGNGATYDAGPRGAQEGQWRSRAFDEIVRAREVRCATHEGGNWSDATKMEQSTLPPVRRMHIHNWPDKKRAAPAGAPPHGLRGEKRDKLCEGFRGLRCITCERIAALKHGRFSLQSVARVGGHAGTRSQFPSGGLGSDRCKQAAPLISPLALHRRVGRTT